jgi:hypothetical protein
LAEQSEIRSEKLEKSWQLRLPDGSLDDPGGGAQKESAAPAGPRNGAKTHEKAANLPSAVYVPPDAATQALLVRLDDLARRFEPSWFGTLPPEILKAVALADALDFDPYREDGGDDEPSLGWTVSGTFGDMQDLEYAVDDGDEEARSLPWPGDRDGLKRPARSQAPPQLHTVECARDGKPMTAQIITFTPRPKPKAGGTLRIVSCPAGDGRTVFIIGIKHPNNDTAQLLAHAYSLSEARLICAKWPGYQVLDLTNGGAK